MHFCPASVWVLKQLRESLILAQSIAGPSNRATPRITSLVSIYTAEQRKTTWGEVSCHSSQILTYRRLTLQLVDHHTPTKQGIFIIFCKQSAFYQKNYSMQTNTIVYCNGNI